MSMRILRLVLLLGVILGVVLPKTSAALADLGLSGGETVVICTGHGLQEISLSSEGTPAKAPAPHEEAPCLLVHALDSVSQAALPVWVTLAREFHPVETTHLWSGDHRAPTCFARAPPRG
jgi:hypothetical protein